tara:strand:- start:296 stop:1498 length:1203 start_codon:yes stop_codon:yes gene_type:complete
MNVANKYNIILYSQIYIVVIYCLNLLLPDSLFHGFFFLIYLIVLFYLIFNNFFSELTITKTIILIFLFIGLSSPTTAWDARSVWMFHGKRMFFENNVLAQLDDYGKLNNDYPIFVSYYASQIANLLGKWNEILPKLSPFLISLPILIFLSSVAKNKKQELIICFLYLFILDKKMIMGECDAILSIYLVLIFTLIFKPDLKLNSNINKSLYKQLFIFSALVIFSNLKTISPLVVVIILIVYIFSHYRNLDNRIFFLFVISMLPITYYKYVLSFYEIEKHLLEFLLTQNNIKLIFTDFSSHIKILNKILFNKEMLITSILVSVYFSKQFFKNKSNKIKLSKNFLEAAYIFILFVGLIYFITAIFIGHQFYDQLLLQIPRYIAPACFLITFETVNQLFRNSKN